MSSESDDEDSSEDDESLTLSTSDENAIGSGRTSSQVD